jgi:hypothetical protein
MSRASWSPLALALLIIASGPDVLHAQRHAAAADTARARMSALAFLHGEWEGTGTLMQGPGRSATARAREVAEPRLDGTLLVVEGIGRAATQAGDGEHVVHHAFGVVSWDAAAGGYRMTAYRVDGSRVHADVTVGRDSLVWGFKEGEGPSVRFTVALTPEGRWHEIGEYSMDGARWTRFLEMTLARVEIGAP